MNTKRLVTVAVLIALYTVLSLFSANLGLIKLTFESFPVLVASLMFGWVDGLLVGAVGGLLNQMLTYGVYRHHADVDSAQRRARPAGGPLRQKAWP